CAPCARTACPCGSSNRQANSRPQCGRFKWTTTSGTSSSAGATAHPSRSAPCSIPRETVSLSGGSAQRKLFSKSAAKSQRGAAIVEVGLLIALVAAIGVVSIRTVGKNVKNTFATTYVKLGGSGVGVNTVNLTVNQYCTVMNPADPICN